MKFLVLISFLVLCIQLCLCQRQQPQGMFRIKGDYMDVPVRAGYRVVGNDDDGFLEDGIIVKQKGTGYIDQRFKQNAQRMPARDMRDMRDTRDMRGSASQIIYGRPVWFRQ